MTLRTLNYENYGIFLIMGHAGFCPSTEGYQAWLLARQDRGIERNQITFDLNRKSARCFEV